MTGFHPADPAFEPTKAAIRPTLERVIRDEERVWHGWYRNHGGELVFFGDRFGGGDATSVLLVLLSIGMLWKMWRQAPRVTVAAARKPKSSRSRHKR